MAFGFLYFMLAAFYKDVKVLIVPLPPMNIHFVIVCLRSANAELIMCKFHEALAQIETISKPRNRPKNVRRFEER